MKKRFIVFLILLVMVAPVFATGTKEAENNDVVTLTAYMQIDPASSQYEGHNRIMEAFAEANPNIKLNVEYAGGEAFHDKFKAMAASGDIPDLYTCYVGARTGYVTETGLTMDLRPLLTDEFKDSFVSATWATPQGKNGEIYTVPPSLAVCHSVYVNTKLLHKLGLEMPKTFEELMAQVPVIREAGYYPMSMGNRDAWVVNSWLLSVLVDRFGGREWFEDAAHGKNGAKFTDEPFVKSLEVIDRMTKEGLFSPGVNQMGNGEADQEFYQGKSVYLMDAGWRTSSMDKDLPKDFVDGLEMIVLPAFEGEVSVNSSTAVPSEGFGIAKAIEGTKKADAAWKFIQFYMGEEGAKLRASNGGVPTYKLPEGSVDMKFMQNKFAQFSEEHPMGYVFDSVMNGEGVAQLNADIQSMMLGNGNPKDIAAKYEKWVAENDTNRD